VAVSAAAAVAAAGADGCYSKGEEQPRRAPAEPVVRLRWGAGRLLELRLWGLRLLERRPSRHRALDRPLSSLLWDDAAALPPRLIFRRLPGWAQRPWSSQEPGPEVGCQLLVCFRYRLPNFPHSPAGDGRERQRLGIL